MKEIKRYSSLKVILEIIIFFKNLISHRKLIAQLVKSDFLKKFKGSLLGYSWNIINPVITILIFIFVFQYGFKVIPVGNIPFVLWLSVGIIPWFYFSEVLSQGSGSVLEYNYLVKKVLFNIEYLPLVKTLSSLFVHFVLVLAVIIILLFYGYFPNIYWLQFGYYLFATFLLLLGICWMTSSLAVFIRDTLSVVGIVVQFGFWLTPIFWPLEHVPLRVQQIIKLNPVFYIVQGYRDTFLLNHWFWERPRWTLYFWGINIFIFFIGFLFFKKTRPYFADVI